MSPPVPLLTAHHLDVSVPGRSLVRQLDLELFPGEFLAVLGQNGAGKTLTLHTLAGLRYAAAGELCLAGSNMALLPRRQIAKRLALLLQYSDDIFPSTVFDTVLVGRHPHIDALRLESTYDREIARRSLREVGLLDLADRDVTTLSGGERRRLAIAQTLAQTPSVYLLDEPLNHLNPQHQLDVLELLHGRTRQGGAVAATLHDVNLAMRYADRCLLLFGDGRWHVGATADVLTADRLSELFEVRMESVAWRGSLLFVAAGRGGGSARPRADARSSIDESA